MRFLKHHQFFLAFVAVLLLCSVMVVRQYLANQYKHVDLREDLVVLCDEGKTRGAERLYQMLVQELPKIPDRMLVDDEQRLAFVLAQKQLSDDDLLRKYFISVQNELKHRIPERVARAQARAGTGGE